MDLDLSVLGKVVIGIVVAAAGGYSIYKYLSRDDIKKKINEKFNEKIREEPDSSEEAFKEAFKDKVESSGEIYKLSDMAQWDEPLEQEVVRKPYKAKYKAHNENTFTFSVLDQRGELLEDIDLQAGGIADDIKLGDEIILVD